MDVINRIELKDFLVFKGDFTADFCPGVNVLIGGNGTGKTTLLKCLFYGADRFSKPRKYPEIFQNYFGIFKDYSTKEYGDNINEIMVNVEKKHGMIRLHIGKESFEYSFSFFSQPKTEAVTLTPVYIPEKDILEHAKGLLPFIEQKETGFSPIYKDVLVKAQDTQTKEQTKAQKKIGGMIKDIIGGTVQWEPSEGIYYTVRTDGMRIPFAAEASGFKKLGYLGLLVVSGQLKKGSVLFWDEPENSLNPEFVPKLVDILLELSRNGVQIFLATHSEILASYFAVNRKKGDNVMFTSLYKDKKGENIKADTSDRFDLLKPNNLTAEPVKLYERQIERGLGGGK